MIAGAIAPAERISAESLQHLKTFFPLFVVALALCSFTAAAPLHQRISEPRAESSRRLLYTIDLHQPGRLHISLETSSPALGAEFIDLPSQWAEARGLEAGIQNLKITGSGVALEPTARPSRFTARARPGTTMRLDYDLVEDWTGPFLAPSRHRVQLRPELIAFNGSNALVAPQLDPAAPVQASFIFQGLPSGRTLVTSFGTQARQTASGPWSEVQNALFTVGNFRTRQLTIAGAPVLLAVTGRWSFADQELALKVHAILAAESVFWGDAPPSWYAVVLAPFDSGTLGGGGTAFTHLCSLYLAPGESLGPETEALFAHEAFHAWNPTSLGPVPDMPPVAWFVEGVTTFYQDLMLDRARLIDRATLLKRRNLLLREYFLSRHTTPTSSAETSVSLDDDQPRQREPYLRGAMLALWLDTNIRQQSHAARSLDDLMRSLEAEPTEPLTNTRLFAAAARFVEPATAARFRTLVETGAEVPLLPGSLGPCIVLRPAQTWTFDLGLPAAQLRNGAVLEGVDPVGPAFGAGVRDGQTLLGWSLWHGDPDHEVTLTIRQGEAASTRLRYLPRGSAIAILEGEPVPGCSAQASSQTPAPPSE